MADLEQDEQTEQSPALDSTLPGPTQTGRAVSIARLLHHECGLLLQLYVSPLYILYYTHMWIFTLELHHHSQ